MYTISQRREAARRIADPADIPTYRRLLRIADSPFAGHLDPNPKKLAVFLVSALLDTMSEEDIVRSVKGSQGLNAPPAADVSAAASEPAPDTAIAAVKKNGSGRTSSIRASAGRTWTRLSSGLRTLFSRTPSTSADGSAKRSHDSTSGK